MLLVNINGQSPAQESQRQADLQNPSPAAEDQPLYGPSPKLMIHAARQSGVHMARATRRAHSSEIVLVNLCSLAVRTVAYKLLLGHHRLGTLLSLAEG